MHCGIKKKKSNPEIKFNLKLSYFAIARMALGKLC